MRIYKPRFTLRHMMIFVTGVCMGLGAFVMWLSQIKSMWHDEQLAIAKIPYANYSYVVSNRRMFGPEWLRYFVEDEYRYRMTSIDLWDIEDEPLPATREIDYLLAFSKLETLDLQGSSFNDDHMSVVSRISTLKTLICFDTDISKSGIETLTGMNQLEILALENLNDINNDNLRQLAGIKNLRSLFITSYKLPPDAEDIFRKLRPDVEASFGSSSFTRMPHSTFGMRWPPDFGSIASGIKINPVPPGKSIRKAEQDEGTPKKQNKPGE